MEVSPIGPYSIRPIIPKMTTVEQTRGLELADLSMQKKLQNNHVQAHHASEYLYLARQKIRKDMGFEEDSEVARNIQPFPASHNLTYVNNDNAGLLATLEKLIEKVSQPAPAPVVVSPVVTPVSTPTEVKTPPIQINPIPSIKPTPSPIVDNITPQPVGPSPSEEPWYKKYAAWILSVGAVVLPVIGTVFGWSISGTNPDPVKPPVVEQPVVPADPPVNGKIEVNVK